MIYRLVCNTWMLVDMLVDFPNTSFPSDLSTAILPDGYAYCHPSTPPACGEFERVEQATPQMVDGGLVQQWTVVPWALTEIDEYIANKRKSLVCGPWQLRQALRVTGDYQQFISIIKSADELTQEAFEYASEYRRDSELVENMRLALGKTHEEVDSLFELAMTL